MSDAVTPGDQVPDLERFRAYLVILARMELGAHLCGKISASDVVQETMLEAVRVPQRFRDRSESEQLALLRRMLARKAARAGRDLGRRKRDVARERSLDAALESSSVRLMNCLADKQPSPSERAIQNERIFVVADAIEALPAAQRDVVLLHFVESLSTGEIAARLDRTPDSVSGLLRRGLRKLRESVDRSR